MPELRPGSSRCKCAACGAFFASTRMFDDHRVGPHDERRRCRTAEEIERRGFVLRDGVWHSAEVRPDHLNAATVPFAFDEQDA